MKLFVSALVAGLLVSISTAADKLPVPIKDTMEKANQISVAKKMNLTFAKAGSAPKAVTYAVNPSQKMLVSFSSTDGISATDIVLIAKNEGYLRNSADIMLASLALIQSVDPKLEEKRAAAIVMELIKGCEGGKKKKAEGEECSYTASMETPGIFDLTMAPK